MISVAESQKRHADGAVFVDGSWHLSQRDGRKEYEAGPRIEKALFFDIDDVATKGHITPHMMPSKDLFARVMDEFGITPESDVILYGTEGCFSLARTFLTFRSLGHSRVHIMQGSLKDWIDAKGPIESGAKKSLKVDELSENVAIKYDTAVDAKNMVDMRKMIEVIESGEKSNALIVDARSAGRFIGEAPEPRPGLRGGHMPSALNVPFNILLEGDNKFQGKETIVQAFKDAGVDVETEKDIICTCGSGVTASWLALALEECGRDPSKTFVYDGSWIEWASDLSNPVVKD
jgi:thiosulfate/3-mercaptopyruvate sulfurtransferase